MAKVANVKLTWSKSKSDGVVGTKIVVNNDGIVEEHDLPPDVEYLSLVIGAGKTCEFKVITYGTDSLSTPSDSHAFTLGSLTPPEPATDLSHEIESISDV